MGPGCNPTSNRRNVTWIPIMNEAGQEPCALVNRMCQIGETLVLGLALAWLFLQGPSADMTWKSQSDLLDSAKAMKSDNVPVRQRAPQFPAIQQTHSWDWLVLTADPHSCQPHKESVVLGITSSAAVCYTAKATWESSVLLFPGLIL